MQIPISRSLYYTAVVMRRPEIWGPKCIALFESIIIVFYENIINNDTNHKNYDTTLHQSYSTYFNSIGKTIHTLPRCGLVTIQIDRHILCSIRFLCGFVCQGVFFLAVQFCKVVDFTLPLLYPNLKLQYLMNYSSDFNNFCRFQILEVCTTLL